MKMLQELITMEKKLQKMYLASCNLFRVQDLWQVHFQILSIVFLNEFIDLDLNLDQIITNVKSIANVFLNTQILKMM